MLSPVVTCQKAKAPRVLPELLSTAGFRPTASRLLLVKSNICGMYHPDSRLIERTLQHFAPQTQHIVIGETDSMGHTPEEQFQRLGIVDLVTRFSGTVEAMNLMRDEVLDVDVPSPHTIHHLPIPKLVLDCDLLVNIAKVGTHSRTMLTCALKNLFGLLAEKRKFSVYHPLGVDQVIADLAKIVRCDLTIVDAKDQVLVSVDPLSVDILACRFVGLNPLHVEHLQLVASDRHLKLEDVVNHVEVIKT
jgi:uncharacterized protein (DUF362 family)